MLGTKDIARGRRGVGASKHFSKQTTNSKPKATGNAVQLKQEKECQGKKNTLPG